MRRLTILLAAMGALMLVPAAQAFAVPSMKVNITGSGQGEITSADTEFEVPGTPPITCSYNGISASGVCENTPEEPEFEGFASIGLVAHPAPGSEFGGWTVQKGFAEQCPAEFDPLQCFVYNVEEGKTDFEVTATFNIEVGGPELTVVKEGSGSGTVVSNPAGIECGPKCSSTAFAENTKVTLTASPSAGSTFVSWKGCEKGGVNGRQCTVTMDKAKTVNAKFLTAYNVIVSREGSGLGKISSSPGGVLCLSNCSSTTASFKEGTSVTLTAAPSKNYVFTKWTGACSGSSPTCSLGSLSTNRVVHAEFTQVAQHNLTVDKSGGGNGTVKSNLAGINCGATCSSMAALYFQGQEVELTATPGKGSSFGGWSGSGCSGTGTCKVTMSGAKSVTAEFK